MIAPRADVADVEAEAKGYSFVADAKVFRMSRTARNPKDFKVHSMDKWKYGKTYAMLVCPLYQLPGRHSQIYEQAASMNVCLLSYSHLAVLSIMAERKGRKFAIDRLREVFDKVKAMSPSENASAYWTCLNQTMIDGDDYAFDLWEREKIAMVESIRFLKGHALDCFDKERDSIMQLSHQDALDQLIDVRKIIGRIETIESISEDLPVWIRQ